MAPALDDEVPAAAVVPLLTAPPPIVVVGAGTPEVNGASDTELAPEKAGAPDEAVLFAVAVSDGFSTLFRANQSRSMPRIN